MERPKWEMAEVPAEEMWLLLLSSLRYAMGRRSYITSTVAELVEKYFDTLTSHQQRQVVQEIRVELERAAILGGLVGDKCDHSMWEDAARKLEAKIAK